jgi:polyhydroxyalkanoate synthesis regulator phasin
MAQSRGGARKRSGGSSAKKATKKKAAAKKSTAKKSTAKKSTAAKRSPAKKSSAKKSSAAKSSPAKKRSSAKKRGAGSTKSSSSSRRRASDFSGKSVADFRQALTERLVEPLNLVMLTRERIEETVEEAVSRGSMTRDAAQDLISGLVDRGRRQTTDVLSDLEQLLGRSRGTEVAARARKQVGDATARAREAGDQVIAQADRARRVAGVGPSFPIIGYDDLTAAQVESRIDTLTPAELRKVRDYERRNANRKSVLAAIESKLA